MLAQLHSAQQACRMRQFDKFFFCLGALWFLGYHNVLYADKRILSGVKILKPCYCSSFSQQQYNSEVYEKLVPLQEGEDRGKKRENFVACPLWMCDLTPRGHVISSFWLYHLKLGCDSFRDIIFIF